MILEDQLQELPIMERFGEWLQNTSTGLEVGEANIPFFTMMWSTVRPLDSVQNPK